MFGARFHEGSARQPDGRRRSGLMPFTLYNVWYKSSPLARICNMCFHQLHVLPYTLSSARKTKPFST